MRTISRRHNHTKTSQLVEAVRTSLRFGWATVPMIAAYVLVVVFTFLWFEPAPIAKYYRTVSKVDVYPGEQVVINATITRSKGGCDSMVTRTWIGEDGVMIVKSQFPMPKFPAGREEYSRPAVIPPTAVPGHLWLQTEVEFFCNSIQRVMGGTHFPMSDIYFNVLPIRVGSGPKALVVIEEAFAGEFP